MLSSDENEWEAWARETVEAEAYSRRLGKRIREGYAAKFRRLADPGGHAPLGFRRTVERPQTLEVDPLSIDLAVQLFVEYAGAGASIHQLARSHGMNDRTVNDILKNPIYNGWVLRKGDRSAAPWRDDPPVDDALWMRVQELMAVRTRGGGPRNPDRPDPLRGLVTCTCGSSYRSSGMMGGKLRRIHAQQPCPDGVLKKIWDSETWLAPIEAQIAGIRLDGPTVDAIAEVLRAPGTTRPQVDPRAAHRRRRQLADAFAVGRISERDLIDEMGRLRTEAAAEGDAISARPVDVDRAMDYIRNFAVSWARAQPQAKTALIQSVYAQIVVQGAEFVSVRLTPEAYAHGLAAALPKEVEVPALPTWGGRRRAPQSNMALARPTGVGRGITTYTIPIEGRDEWLAAARRLA